MTSSKLFYYSGIDEVAYGPILGPYFCALFTFTTTSPDDLYFHCRDFISREKSNEKIRVADSKKIYRSTPSEKSKGLKELELIVLSFISNHLGYLPDSFSQLFTLLSYQNSDLSQIDAPLLPIDFTSFKSRCGSLASLTELDWYKPLLNYQLPLFNTLEDVRSRTSYLSQGLKQAGVVIADIHFNFANAKKLNQIFLNTNNKVDSVKQILHPLLVKGLSHPYQRLMIDRQGGRSYYRDWIRDIFPSADVSTIVESGQSSSYLCEKREISFRAKADDQYMEVALSSMLAKYLREVVMISFNEYWKEKAKSQSGAIKETAGYFVDGRRFIEQLKNLNILPPEEIFIRQR